MNSSTVSSICIEKRRGGVTLLPRTTLATCTRTVKVLPEIRQRLCNGMPGQHNRVMQTGQFDLGALYWQGRGVPQDFAEAARWFQLAAKQGYAKAQAALGDLYLVGWGVPRDNRAAQIWFRKAAEQGVARAQNKLGILYLKGQGAPPDDSLAAAWFAQAAEHGDHDAQANLATLYEAGRGVARDLTHAYMWRLLSYSSESRFLWRACSSTAWKKASAMSPSSRCSRFW